MLEEVGEKWEKSCLTPAIKVETNSDCDSNAASISTFFSKMVAVEHREVHPWKSQTVAVEMRCKATVRRVARRI